MVIFIENLSFLLLIKYIFWDSSSGVECVCGGGGGGGGVKPLVYSQWLFCHVTLIKWINTTASI